MTDWKMMYKRLTEYRGLENDGLKKDRHIKFPVMLSSLLRSQGLIMAVVATCV